MVVGFNGFGPGRYARRRSVPGNGPLPLWTRQRLKARGRSQRISSLGLPIQVMRGAHRNVDLALCVGSRSG